MGMQLTQVKLGSVFGVPVGPALLAPGRCLMWQSTSTKCILESMTAHAHGGKLTGAYGAAALAKAIPGSRFSVAYSPSGYVGSFPVDDMASGHRRTPAHAYARAPTSV